MIKTDESLDLVLSRVMDAPPALVWKAWTEPEHLVKWWAPLPYTTVECRIDLRPGGVFRTVMKSPEGELIPHDACWLEVVRERRLVWTDALQAGYRPQKQASSCLPWFFTASIEIEPAPGGKTRYTAIAMHADPKERDTHEEMGFHEGWGTCATQLESLAASLG